MKTSHFEPLPKCPTCKLRLGEGECFGCVRIRATLERMDRLTDHETYKRIQWLASRDAMLRERTLERVEAEIGLESE